MSKSKEVKKAARSFTVRNIKKDFTTYDTPEVITKQYHIELGEKNETFIVEDRPTDWQELANKDADKVGLANVLSIVERQGLDVRSFAVFKDNEALDLSELDPLDPNAYTKAQKAEKSAMAELEATANRMGVTVDSLINAALHGKIDELVKVPEKKEGE